MDTGFHQGNRVWIPASIAASDRPGAMNSATHRTLQQPTARPPAQRLVPEPAAARTRGTPGIGIGTGSGTTLSWGLTTNGKRWVQREERWR